MLVKASPELQQAKLCPFLKQMDEEELRVQHLSKEALKTQEEREEFETRLRLEERSICQVGVNSAAGIGGGLLGGVTFGPIGAVIVGGICAWLSNATATTILTTRECGMDAEKPRLNRLNQKIEKIKKEKLNPSPSSDVKQLDLAEKYLQATMDRYARYRKTKPSSLYGSGPHGNVSLSFDRNGKPHANGTWKNQSVRQVNGQTFYEEHIHHLSDVESVSQ